MRALVLFGVVVGALVALLWARPAAIPGGKPPRLAYITTAHQLGVVGYRDPVGAISLDATRLAKSTARRLTSFSRDAYAPSVAANGARIAFTVWSYDAVFFAMS